ncbi:P-loop containing nucleoside triphosphate hydrolase [Sesbania bispinosa]|nr:P-loop containing nucleoside triphosphate hydrolase [Sesbania bispinosa]
MRTGSCGVQQGLTSEAASIVKQAVTLAKRRGHAQVTPLHVANTMLAVTNGLLRRACLQSHSHPLQCKALELCFNVALNRLPAASSSMGSHSHCPSISNALVAAFKRAQAHQRRGSIENHQQQPLLAVKVEVEQLVISILDDPSVSRVMREAGFSSIQVKTNVEQVVISSQNNSLSVKENNNLTLSHQKVEDIASVIDNLLNQRRRSTVIVGECLTSLEGVVKGVMDKVDKGDVSESLRGVKFISLSLSDFSHVSRVEVERKVEDLRRFSNSKGHILYLGDLKWVFEYMACSRQSERGYYCPVDHLIMEIGKLVSGVGEYGRFWLMGIATFQAYMRCKNGHPSLETVWGLHPVTIPAGTLCLSLITDSGLQNQSTEIRSWQQDSTCNSYSSTSTLPTWLQQYKNENNSNPNSTSSSEAMEVEYVSKFKEFNSENMKTLYHALEEKVPWQKDIIPEIVSTVLKCRSGMLRRKGNVRSNEVKVETWLFFQGVDVEAKEKIARELASLVFGSKSNLISIPLSRFSTKEYCRNKRSREEPSCSYINRFVGAVSSNPHRVFLIEDIDQADYSSQLYFKRAMERGSVSDSNGEEFGLCDAIIILSCKSLDSRSRANCYGIATSEETMIPCVSLDLNISIDNDCNDDHSVDEIGLLESVDRRIIFKTQEL